MKALFLTLLAIVLIPINVLAASFQWDYPYPSYDYLGFVIHFTEGVDTYTKIVLPTDCVRTGDTFTYSDIENKLNLKPGVEYTFFMTAYDDAFESDPSNSITYTRARFLPVDKLPAPITPKPPVTIFKVN